ncbi:MAG: transporter substrate-binding domain-containing protein [Candidatus Saganbacteria bacterium]|nr:transporter substrate-binding domain-containing protein [Candidatus Saganbacteria bacterium]
MKIKFLFVLLVITVFIAITAFIVSINRETRDYLLMSGHPEYPPFMWQEGDKIVGVGPEILSTACKELGIPFKNEFTGSWDQVFKEAQAGKLDAIVALFLTKERKAYLDYSVAYAKDPVAVFVRKDKVFRYRNWNDLVGRRGTTTVGDSYGQDFDSFIEAKLKMSRLKTAEDNFKALEKGEADYFIYGMYAGLFELKKVGLENQITYLTPYVTTQDFYLAISKKSRYAKDIPAINAIVSRMVKEGKVAQLTDKYLAYFEEKVLDQVRRLAQTGLAYYYKNGQRKAFEEFDKLDGMFSQENLYLFVFDLNGKCLAHGADHSLIGKNLIGLKDVDGKFFIKDFISVAQNPGQGWVGYKWKYKQAKEIGPKLSYIKRIKGSDLFIGCGFYPEK